MKEPENRGPHLDVACGYATFLAQLGWRFPTARLVGLNIDFDGPHALARPLLAEANVTAGLVQADARRMPFSDESFGSVSCFLGLQDIEIGFGQEGVRGSTREMVRVLCSGGELTLMSEYGLPEGVGPAGGQSPGAAGPAGVLRSLRAGEDGGVEEGGNVRRKDSP